MALRVQRAKGACARYLAPSLLPTTFYDSEESTAPPSTVDGDYAPCFEMGVATKHDVVLPAPRPFKNKAGDVQGQRRRKKYQDKCSDFSAHPSRGSKNHAMNQCRPCKNFSTPQGCSDGVLCNFCHYDHDEGRVLEADLYSAKALVRRKENNTNVKEKEQGDSGKPALEPWYVPVPSELTWPMMAPGLDSPAMGA